MISGKGDKYAKYVSKVLGDIRTYKKEFNDKNDPVNMSFTFFILKSFAELNNINLSAEDIRAILSIVEERYNIKIPPITFQFLQELDFIIVGKYPDGRKKIKLYTKENKTIHLNLASYFSSDSPVMISDFRIENETEIIFQEANLNKTNKEYFSLNKEKNIDQFFERDLWKNDNKKLITFEESEDIRTYNTGKKNSKLPSMYIKINGLSFDFISSEKVKKSATIVDAVVLPGLTGNKSKRLKGSERSNFYLGLDDIPWGLINQSVTVPL